MEWQMHGCRNTEEAPLPSSTIPPLPLLPLVRKAFDSPFSAALGEKYLDVRGCRTAGKDNHVDDCQSPSSTCNVEDDASAATANAAASPAAVVVTPVELSIPASSSITASSVGVVPLPALPIPFLTTRLQAKAFQGIIPMVPDQPSR